jgi:hypothetical protein
MPSDDVAFCSTPIPTHFGVPFWMVIAVLLMFIINRKNLLRGQW